MSFFRHHRRFVIITLTIFLVAGGVFSFIKRAQGVTRSWDGGGGDNNWSTAANWSGDVVPGSSDAVTFDATSTKNAIWDTSGPATIASLNVTSAYSGNFTISKSTVQVNNWTWAGTGVFSAGTGTVILGVAWTPGSASYYNITFSSGGSSSLSTTGTATILGNLSVSGVGAGGGLMGGTLNVSGNVTCNNLVGGGSTVIAIVGTADQSWTVTTACAIGTVVINKSSGIFSLTSALSIYDAWTYTAGTINLGTSTLNFSGNAVFTGGATQNYGTVNFFSTGSSAQVVSGTITVKNVGFSGSTGTQVNGGGTLNVTENVTTSAGTSGSAGSLNLILNGTGAQTLTSTSGALPAGTVTINKPSGTASAFGNFSVTSFILSSGTFTSTTGTLTVTGDFTHTVGGTFNHNNGTVLLSTNATTKTIDVSTSETFYNLTVYNYAATLAIASGDTLIVLGTFSSTCGYDVGNINTGTVEARGNVVVDSCGNNGSAIINFIVSGDQSITGSGGYLPNVNVNKPSGTLSVTGDLNVNALMLSSGTFTSTTGTLTVNGDFTHTVGGTFNHNNGTVLLSTRATTKTIDVSTSETFYNLTVYNYAATLAIASGDTLIVLGTFSSTAGYSVGNINTGTVEVRGNVVVDSLGNNGSATFSFTGGDNQTYTTSGGAFPDGDVAINKTGGTVTLASDADWNATDQDLTITSGILSQGASYNLTAGAITVSAGGTFLNKGTGDLTVGGTLTNNGLVRLGTGDCGGTDDIAIRSSTTGTQRSWNGTGTFTLYDVDVKDMAGSAAITAYTSTNTGNNGANWTFSAGSCPTVPPAVGLSTGKINLQSGKLNLR